MLSEVETSPVYVGRLFLVLHFLDSIYFNVLLVELLTHTKETKTP